MAINIKMFKQIAFEQKLESKANKVGFTLLRIQKQKTLSLSDIGVANLNCLIFKENTKFEGCVQLRNDNQSCIFGSYCTRWYFEYHNKKM